MGFSFKDIGSTLASGGTSLLPGMTGAAVNPIQYGIGKGFNMFTGGSSEKEVDPNAGMDIYNQGLSNQAKTDAANKKSQYYGSTLSGLGGETEDYVGRLKGNLDKNVAKADLYNQQAGQQRSLDNARAGLSGVDTSAMNEQGRRNASFGAAAINEDAKRQALDVYGSSISNRIEGANKIDNSEMALAIAQMKQPQTNYKPGLIGSIFSGFV
jgi:hypothetical protein